MDDNLVHSVAIIGGGSAGTMAALRTVLNNDDCIMFPGNAKHRKKSRAFWVAKVENIPDYAHYKKGIVEPNKHTIEWIHQSPFKDNLTLMKNLGIDSIEKLPTGLFKLIDNKGNEHLAKYLIVCTGVMDVQPTINGSIDAILPYANIQLVDYCLRCDGHHCHGKNTGVIGHTSDAAWVAIMLSERYSCPSMTIYTHGERPLFDERTTELIKLYNIQINEKKIIEVLGNPKENLLTGYEFADGTISKVEFSFVSLGMLVYNQLAVDLGATVDERGFVITDSKGKTSVDGVFVAGDLRAGIKKQIYTAWDSAVDSADSINNLLRQERRNDLSVGRDPL